MVQVTSSMSTSTSMTQATSTEGQQEFLFSTPMSQDSYNSMQERAHRIFPHISIPFNYPFEGPMPVFSTPTYSRGQPHGQEVEREREISHSQPWSAPLEHTFPGVTSHTAPPTSTVSHLSEEATNEICRFLAQHHPSFRSPHIPSVHQPSLLNPSKAHQPRPLTPIPYHQTPQ